MLYAPSAPLIAPRLVSRNANSIGDGLWSFFLRRRNSRRNILTNRSYPWDGVPCPFFSRSDDLTCDEQLSPSTTRSASRQQRSSNGSPQTHQWNWRPVQEAATGRVFLFAASCDQRGWSIVFDLRRSHANRCVSGKSRSAGGWARCAPWMKSATHLSPRRNWPPWCLVVVTSPPRISRSFGMFWPGSQNFGNWRGGCRPSWLGSRPAEPVPRHPSPRPVFAVRGRPQNLRFGRLPDRSARVGHPGWRGPRISRNFGPVWGRSRPASETRNLGSAGLSGQERGKPRFGAGLGQVRPASENDRKRPVFLAKTPLIKGWLKPRAKKKSFFGQF